MLATEGSFAAQFVRSNHLGWSVPFGVTELNDFLDRLTANPNDLFNRAEAARKFGESNQWTDRAAEAADLLTQ